MAEYKRKRRGAFKSAPKVNKKHLKGRVQNEEIKMRPQEEDYIPKKKMRVVPGKKLERKRRLKIGAMAVALIAVIILICELAIPAGIIETFSNWTAVIGGGSYPLNLESSNTVNAVSKGSYYYLLTNSSISAFSNSGKKIFSYSHGFENPVLKTSETRALVFEQGGTQALIFTLNDLESTVETKQKIKNAAIGDDGTYALVTTADNYAAQVSVYDKNDELQYEWFSSNDLVNNVAVAPSGKKIAVSTIKSNVGKYDSNVYVFEFDSATPKFQKTYEGTVVYTLDTSHGSGFSTLTSNKYDFVYWSDYETVSYSNEYSTSMFRASDNGIAIVYNRESDKTDNRIVVFSDDGELESELEFKGIITDFALRDGNIYCICDTKAYILDEKGEIMRSKDCGFGVIKICPTGQDTVAVITDNIIDEIKLEQE